MPRLTCPVFALVCAASAFAQISITDDSGAITVKDGDAQVLVYHYEAVSPPGRIPERYARADYIHPLYGLDGEILTQDFPFDHVHHRGVFWAWPDSDLGGRKIDIWTLLDAREAHLPGMRREIDSENGRFIVENAWVFDDNATEPVVRELVEIQAHPEKGDARNIDFTLTFTNVSDEVLTLRGATTDDKGYGGFSFRPDARRRPMHFTTADGPAPQDEDQLENATPWMDVSFATEKGGDKMSGVAIFQHPDNPGFPHPGWMARHYGFLGQSWPHRTPHVLNPGDVVTLKYRLYIHRNDAQLHDVAAAFAEYLEASRFAGKD